jgi:hypothetical protein
MIEFSFSTEKEFVDFLENQFDFVLSKMVYKSIEEKICVFENVEDHTYIFITGEEKIWFH